MNPGWTGLPPPTATRDGWSATPRMLSALFGLITAAEVVLLGMVIALRRRRPDWTLTLLMPILLGLIWDNRSRP